ncbi:sensor histidine kinase [Myroides fluvii]|uniref:sensor histidine kinase n=1 Tax=Myroides fluvii TaxID=2572594 RepID=UPI00131CD1F1|nr:ATP-binding protein [Myroides fluvii]
MFFTKSLPYFYLALMSLFLFASCNHKQTKHQTDIENLYAIKRTPAQKDSISKKYEGDVDKILRLTNTVAHQTYIDSVLNGLRYASNQKAFFAITALAEHDAKKKHDLSRLAQIYEKKAVYYHDNQQLDSVYHYYLQAELLYKKTSDSLALAENVFYQARLFYEAGFDKESEVKLYQALKILQKYPNSPILIEANQLKSFYLISYKEYEASLSILLETYETLKKDEGKYTILPVEKYNLALSNLLGNIAMTYFDLEDYKQAEQYALEALTYYRKSPTSIQVYAHINSTYHLALYYQNQDSNIIDRLTESYQIYTKLNHPFYAIDVSIFISDIYWERNQMNQSQAWLEQAYTIANANNFYNHKKEIIENILTKHKDIQTSNLVKELIEVNYLLDSMQKETLESFAKIEYNTLILEQENETLKQRIYFVYLGAFIIIGTLLFILIYVRLKNRNKDLAHSNSQKSKNEQIMNLLIENNTIENVTILKERNRIAKDLHDGIINSIFTLRFNTQLLEIPNETLKGMLVDELVHLENKVRDISHSFSQQNIFQNKSFEKLLTELVGKQSNKNRTSFSIAFESNLCLEHLTTVQKVNIYQIIQEAFQNVNKHACASLCKLKVTTEKNCIVLSIKDNGKGIKPSTSFRGIGLSNMKERAQLIGAQLTINSDFGKGTAIHLYLTNN